MLKLIHACEAQSQVVEHGWNLRMIAGCDLIAVDGALNWALPVHQMCYTLHRIQVFRFQSEHFFKMRGTALGVTRTLQLPTPFDV